MSMIALIRPDSWNFPLFLHVLGAMILVGGLLTGASALAGSETANTWLGRRAARSSRSPRQPYSARPTSRPPSR